jgi:hypothetical protein
MEHNVQLFFLHLNLGGKKAMQMLINHLFKWYSQGSLLYIWHYKCPFLWSLVHKFYDLVP